MSATKHQCLYLERESCLLECLPLSPTTIHSGIHLLGKTIPKMTARGTAMMSKTINTIATMVMIRGQDEVLVAGPVTAGPTRGLLLALIALGPW